MKILLFLFSLVPVVAWSQSPGGISTSNLKLWNKANAGLTTSGSRVTSWTDQTGVNTFTVTGTPQRVTTGLNYNPTVLFNGGSYFAGNTTISNITQVFVVGKINNNVGRSSGAMIGTTTSLNSVQYFFHTESNSIYCAGATTSYSRFPNGSNHVPYSILMEDLGKTPAANDVIRINGEDKINDLRDPGIITTPAIPVIGARTVINGTSGSPLQEGLAEGSEIAEAILFTTSLNATDVNQIESYLAVKYGITLSHNYTSANGTVIYNPSTFGNNIIGIGQDAGSALLQKQSHTLDDSVRLYLSELENSNQSNNGTFSGDGQFLVLGDDNDSLQFLHSAEIPSGVPIASRLGREWKLTNTGFTGNFSIDIKVASEPSDPSRLKLLVHTTDDFTNGTIFEGAAISYSGGVVSISGLSPALVASAQTVYFTLVQATQAPGGINANMQLWLKADDGALNDDTAMAANGDDVAAWHDQSGMRANDASARIFNGNNLSYDPPRFRLDESYNINYNPVVDFDGENDGLDFYDDYIFSSGTGAEDGMTWLAVLQPDTTSGKPRQFIFDFGLYGNNGYGLMYGSSHWGMYTPNVNAGEINHDNVHNFFTRSVLANLTINFGNNQTFAINGGSPLLTQSIGLTALSAAQINASPNHTTGTGPFTIGRQAKTDLLDGNGGRLYDGSIAELIGFSKVLTAAELSKVQSYLAIKYGITLDSTGGGSNGDYVSSNGDVVWNADDNSSYHNQVIGIGRDDNGVLLQKQSHTSDDSTRIYLAMLGSSNIINAGSFDDDRQFVMIGNNGSAMSFGAFSEYPSDLPMRSRLGREWKITNTDFEGSFKVDIVLLPGAYDTAHIQVLVDDDGDFADAGVYEGAEVSYSGGVVTIGGLDEFSGTKYFTLSTIIHTPGGVDETHLKMWNRADAGLTEAGGSVTGWDDQLGVNNFTATGAPALQASALNYNPTILFNGSSYFTGNTGISNITQAFVAGKINNGVDNASGAMLGTTVVPESGSHQYFFHTQGGSLYNIGDMTGGFNRFPQGSNNVPYSILMEDLGRTPAASDVVRINGEDKTNLADDPTAITGEAIPVIGARTLAGGAQSLSAGSEIAEAILFDSSLSPAEVAKVETYLAVKYGITLPNNYVDANGTTIYDVSTYGDHIIGIGRDDNSALLQKQSHTSNDSLRLYLGSLESTNAANTGSFSTNAQFMMLGDDNGAMTFGASSEYPLNFPITSRLGREWKLTNTNFEGAFSVSAKLDLTGIDPSMLRLLVDADGDFTNAVLHSSVMISYSDGIVTLGGLSHSGVDFGTTRYATLAVMGDPVSPGGISNNLQLWLKANDGPFSNATPAANGEGVSDWVDKSRTRSRNATDTLIDPSTQTVVPPTFLSNAADNINYNPVVDFDGANDALDLRGDYIFSSGMGSENGMTWLAIVQPDASSGKSRQFIFDFGSFAGSGYGLMYGASHYGIYTATNSSGSGNFDISHNFSTRSVLTNFTINLGNNQTFALNGGAALVQQNIGTGSLTATQVLSSDLHRFGSGPFTIGRQSKSDGLSRNGGRLFDGSIAELIGFNRVVTGNELKRVESYLAIKYGITLDNGVGGSNGNYISSNEATVWSAESGYQNQIIGIARDDSSALLQKQSHSEDDATRIYLSTLQTDNTTNTGSFDTDHQFVIMGHNGELAAGSTEPIESLRNMGIVTRMERTWKISNTAFTGTFSIDIIPAFGSYDEERLRILVDDDGDFSEGALLLHPSVNASEHLITLSDLSNSIFSANSTKYFTIVTIAVPGGISANLNFWLRADAGTATNTHNTALASWQNSTNTAYTFSQGSATSRPTFKHSLSDDINYNPVVAFDGGDDYLINTGAHRIQPDSSSLFAVVTNTASGIRNIVSSGAFNGQGMEWGLPSGSSALEYLENDGAEAAVISGSAIPSDTAVVVAVTATNQSNGINHFINSLASGTGTLNKSPNTQNTIFIGASRLAGGRHWSGSMPEIIAYNGELTPDERVRIESYLAMKYGITLDNTNGSGNYLSTIGDTLWNAAESGSYHNQVIAIGRDDNTALLQKQSHTADDATRIYLATLQNSNDANTGSFENDGEFLMAGNNNGSLAFASSAEQPSGIPIQSRMGREWKLTNTNFAGAFSIDITPSAGSYDTNLLRVLVDDDGDFTNAAIYTSASISYAAGVITVSNISNSLLNINTTRYITVAIFSNTPVAPGGIAPNLQLWLKANDGVMFNGSPSTDGGNVSLWQDKSGARFRNATDTLLVVEAPFAPATNLVVPPTFKSNTTDNINYNPVVEFDGENDALDLRNDYIFSSGVGKENGMTWLAVLRPKVDNSRTRQFVFDFGGFDESGYGMIYGASAYGVYTPFFADGYTDLDQPHGFSDQPVLTNFTIPLNTQTNVNQTFTINGKETATEEDISGLTGLTNLEVNASVSHDNSSARSGQSFGPFTIGRQSKVDELAEDGGRLYFGSIAELIGYNKVLTDEERSKVETYLAVKYGITLDNAGNGSRGDYVSSGGSILWDASASIGFHRQIIGIGRDDSSTLLQRKSHTMDDTTRIYVPSLSPRSLESDGSFSNDRSFVLMGNDGGQMFNAGDTDFPPEVQSRLNRIWEVDNSGFSDAFSIDFILNTEPDQLANESDLRLLVSTTDDFTNAAVYGENITIDGNVVTVSGIGVDKIPQGSTRFVTLGSLRSLTSLPVSLISFTAQVKDTVVQLDWATAWERNNAYFVIERSANGVSWQPIGRVPASDALTSPAYYSYTDAQPLEGTAYYRLRQTDVDGTYAYSPVRKVKMQRAAGVQIFPNPVTSELTIKGRKADLQNLQVLDVAGKNHTTQLPIRIGETQTVIDMSRLAHGVYFIKINNKTYKVLKSK